MITKSKITLNINGKHFSENFKCSPTKVNFNQIMNIGEGFEGYIEKLNVNFIPFALSTNDQVSNVK